MPDVPHASSSRRLSPRWFTTPAAPDRCHLRLVMFPHAGAGPGVFAAWRTLSPGLEVRGVCLPGRENRIDETPTTDLAAITHDIADSLVRLDPAPLVLFGHSLGALLAFELAHRLGALGFAGLRGIVVAGAAAPQVALPRARLAHLEGRELLQQVADRHGGIGREVLENPELVSLLAPAMRADLQLFEEYRLTARPPLEVPMLALAGRHDRMVAVDQVEAWRELTAGEFAFASFDHGHFFVKEAERQVQRTVLEFVERQLDRPSGAGGHSIVGA